MSKRPPWWIVFAAGLLAGAILMNRITELRLCAAHHSHITECKQ
jgi:hypothetical protein